MLSMRAQVPSLSIEDKWHLVGSRPELWWDNRESKASGTSNPKGPDFNLRSKDIKVALWISSKDTPAWAKEQFGSDQ
jgi:hypothetical protein